MNLPNNTVQNVDEILADFETEIMIMMGGGNIGMPLDRHDRVMESIKKSFLQLILSKIPGELNENGSQGKWVNGWNDYREKVIDILNESFK